jgi:IclR family transcriptional regulator, mhp operon transcriptional activator
MKDVLQICLMIVIHRGAALSDAPDRTYRDVRALWRGMKLLEVLAQIGWAKPSVLSAATGIDRSTVYRLIETLVSLGYVTRRSADGTVAMTRKVRRIAAGVRDDDVIVAIVGRHMAELVHEVKWPSDFARLSNGIITIEESTHRLSSVTFYRATIGQQRSMLRSALGLAILSVLTRDEIAMTIDIAAKTVRGNDINQRSIARAVRVIHRLGYASAIGKIDPNVSAIALPFRARQTVGAINIVFFRKVMSPQVAADRFLGHLQNCVNNIVSEIAQQGK